MPAEDDILLLQLIKQDDEKAFQPFSILILFHSAASCPFICRDKQEMKELAFLSL